MKTRTLTFTYDGIDLEVCNPRILDKILGWHLKSVFYFHVEKTLIKMLRKLNKAKVKVLISENEISSDFIVLASKDSKRISYLNFSGEPLDFCINIFTEYLNIKENKYPEKIYYKIL